MTHELALFLKRMVNTGESRSYEPVNRSVCRNISVDAFQGLVIVGLADSTCASWLFSNMMTLEAVDIFHEHSKMLNWRCKKKTVQSNCA